MQAAVGVAAAAALAAGCAARGCRRSGGGGAAAESDDERFEAPSPRAVDESAVAAAAAAPAAAAPAAPAPAAPAPAAAAPAAREPVTVDEVPHGLALDLVEQMGPAAVAEAAARLSQLDPESTTTYDVRLALALYGRSLHMSAAFGDHAGLINHQLLRVLAGYSKWILPVGGDSESPILFGAPDGGMMVALCSDEEALDTLRPAMPGLKGVTLPGTRAFPLPYSIDQVTTLSFDPNRSSSTIMVHKEQLLGVAMWGLSVLLEAELRRYMEAGEAAGGDPPELHAELADALMKHPGLHVLDDAFPGQPAALVLSSPDHVSSAMQRGCEPIPIDGAGLISLAKHGMTCCVTCGPDTELGQGHYATLKIPPHRMLPGERVLQQATAPPPSFTTRAPNLPRADSLD
eukprot:TRINITY_DN40995_c0_g1_i1.p1 TRINITY_DN40995_c0_g1~~TRINITY_DN40995_c0_g1_i1.p1  ORF type:complete len:402 (+),score=176.70 TRINITY_DN40995_c0_g1_i1:66-1271(+)